MLLAAGGLVFWKRSHSNAPTPATAAPSETEQGPRVSMAPPPPPPPPEVEASAVPEPSASVPTRSIRAGGGCSGACEGTVTGTLQSALAGRGAASRRCYEKALLRDASLQGRMKVRARVGTGGQVCSASMVSDGLQDPGLSNCVLALIRASTLPAPKGGCVDVEIPLSFVPQR